MFIDKILLFTLLLSVANAYNYLTCNKTTVINNFLKDINQNNSKSLINQYLEENIIPENNCNLLDVECNSVIFFLNSVDNFDELKEKIHEKYYNFYNQLLKITSMRFCLNRNEIDSEVELFNYSFEDFYIFITHCIDVKYHFNQFIKIRNEYKELIKFYFLEIPITERFLFSYCES